MSRPNFGPGQGQSDSQALEQVFEIIGKICIGLLWIGGVATVGALVVMFASAINGGDHIADAVSNIEMFTKVLFGGLVMFGVGSAVIWWGENRLAIIHFLLATFLIATPFVVPAVVADTAKQPATLAALDGMQKGGTIFAVLAGIALLVDGVIRVKERLATGMKADQLKFGKGIKQEGAQSTFMGKCWQLPYCRKFVRERCPIFHAKRACWREKVGCMCEEQVIRDAMESKVIPKDVVAAAKMIPRNNKLTATQKRARCKQCVIYNEHQKHKYKLMLFVLNIGYVVFVVLFWNLLLGLTDKLVGGAEDLYRKLSFTDSHIKDLINTSSLPIEAVLLIAILLVTFTYLLKTLEYLIFKAKI